MPNNPLMVYYSEIFAYKSHRVILIFQAERIIFAAYSLQLKLAVRVMPKSSQV